MDLTLYSLIVGGIVLAGLIGVLFAKLANRLTAGLAFVVVVVVLLAGLVDYQKAVRENRRSTNSEGTHSATSSSPASRSVPTPHLSSTKSSLQASPSAGPTVATVAWQEDKVHLPYTYGVDLSAPQLVPPALYHGDFDIGVGVNRYIPMFDIRTPAGALGDGTVPSEKACEAAITSSAIGGGYLGHVHETLCFQSEAGNHIAAITILRFGVLTADNGNPSSDLKVIVWNRSAGG